MTLNIVQRTVVLCFVTMASIIAQAVEPTYQTIEMMVSPAAEPSPALRYTLLPPYADKKEGNAASYYMRAILMRRNSVGKDYDEKYQANEDRWLHWPLDDAVRGEIREFLQDRSHIFAEIREAAYRDHCDWGVRFRDLRGIDVINVRMAEVQECRMLGRLLRLQAHLAIAEHRLDDALESLRHGYQLALDVAEQPTLVNVLVGVYIAAQMDEELQLLMQDPAAPNLHWALCALPDPFIDIRNAMEQEKNIVHQIFPVLKDAEKAERSPEEWQRLLHETVNEFTKLSNDSSSSADRWTQGWFVAYIALNYPRAKQELIDSGLPAEKVEALPVAQVLLIQIARAADYAFDEVFKWGYLPFSDADKFMTETEQKLIQNGYMGPFGVSNRSILPIAGLLLPAMNSASYAPVRLQRNLAALRTIEAIRMYATDKDGKLPQQLTDITQVPLPRDPLTGQLVSYRIDGDAGVLELSAPGFRPQMGGYRYVVRIRK